MSNLTEAEKYRQFRNFMCNELGVTRQDIKAWTKQSVADEVEKFLKGVDLEAMCFNLAKKEAQSLLTGGSWNAQKILREEIFKQIGGALSQQFTIDINRKEQE